MEEYRLWQAINARFVNYTFTVGGENLIKMRADVLMVRRKGGEFIIGSGLSSQSCTC
jgi:hypothetical protein